MWDANDDGVWNKDEFISMSTAGVGIPENNSEYETLFNELFDNLNINDDKDSISAAEFASFLYATDMDWTNYSLTGDLVSSLDGKIDYLNYQALSSTMKGDLGFDSLQSEKADFYNNFYAEAEKEAAKKNSKPVAEQVNTPDETKDVVKKETKISKSKLPEGSKINKDNEILDKNGNIIGRVNISYNDINNDGKKDRIKEYFIFD